MNLAGVVILYRPDKKLIERLNTYKSFLNKFIIIDNSEAKTSLQYLQDSNILIIHDGENKGIASRLNQAAQIALNEGYDWLLTMDQDSFFSGNDFLEYINCVSDFKDSNKVGIFGVEFDNSKTVTAGCNFLETNYLITSGSIINLKVFVQTNKFDEQLFIDHVDHEYCLQVRLKGFKIIKLTNILLNHSLGSVSFHRSVKNLKKSSRTLHSPIRIYYMVRNYLYLSKKYSKYFKKDLKEIRKNVLISIKNNLLYGKQRLLIFKYIISGIIHFKINKSGRYK